MTPTAFIYKQVLLLFAKGQAEPEWKFFLSQRTVLPDLETSMASCHMELPHVISRNWRQQAVLFEFIETTVSSCRAVLACYLQGTTKDYVMAWPQCLTPNQGNHPGCQRVHSISAEGTRISGSSSHAYVLI